MSTISERLAKLERPRSNAAEWCQRLSLFALPYLVIVVLGHRTGTFDTPSSLWLLALGLVILLAAIISGLWGFYDLWSKGNKGGLASARGTILSLFLLAPFVYFALKAFVLPPLYDISTDLESPPEFENALDDRTEGMNVIEPPSEVQKRLQLQSYPKVVARRYPLGSVRVFREVVGLVQERDWTILTSASPAGNAPVDQEGSGLIATPVTDAQGRPLNIPLPKFRPARVVKPQTGIELEVENVSPIGRDPEIPANGVDQNEERYVEAVASSFLFGFESDVVIRIVEEEDSTLVDMRSNSRWGPHDLGLNASRVVAFMADLDLALQGLSE